MGLDISAYSGLEHIDTLPNWEAYEDKYDGQRATFANGGTVEWTEHNWPGRTEGIIPGAVYRINGKEHHFRAGSYSGYNWWREWLCGAIHHVEPKVVWENPGDYQGKPFIELIDFADNEGIIGPVVSAKLAKDFADNREHVVSTTDDSRESQWRIQQYDAWHRAFELAAGDGLVDFH